MPVAYQYGIDPIQFAIIMIVVLVYAGVTPPCQVEYCSLLWGLLMSNYRKR